MSLPERLKVLLVEDNELDARSMLRLLANLPEVEVLAERVDTLSSCAAILDETAFDCVLLDLSLPDSSGVASVDAIYQHSPGIPVVVLTGLDDPAAAVRAVEHGAQDYLIKGAVDAATLGRSIRYSVARHHAETELRAIREQLEVQHDRERIGRDLHDTVVQRLFATGMGLQSVVGRVGDDTARERIRDAVTEIDDAIRQLREAIFGMHNAGRSVTLSEDLVGLAVSQSDHLGFTPAVRVAGDLRRIDAELGGELLSVVSEGLSNVAKHAGASAAQVVVDVDADEVVVRVADNGRGLSGATSDPSELTGRGLGNLDTRASTHEGSVSIGAAPGGGTELVWRVPLPTV